MRDKSPHPDSYPQAALVTGGARRIGRALAIDLAAQGYAVALHYHASEAQALSAVAEIAAAGGKAAAVRADLSKEEEMQGLIARCEAQLGPLGILVNNASIFEYDDVNTADRDSWHAHIEPNLRAPLVLSQRFAERLPQGQGGLIVNMLDSRVINPTPRYLSYTVSKVALWSLTQSLAQALSPRIRVNGIGPGPVLPSLGQSDEEFLKRCEGLPLRRPASLEEICAALRFLVSVRSVTGQMIAMDGGNHLASISMQQLMPPHHAGQVTS